MNRVVCAVSGGVDSAVAALLLKRKGFTVIGAFMKNWDLTDENGYCGIDKEREYASKVCDALKIPFHEVNFVKEYWNNVFQHTIDEYHAGRTPNPDILCNKHIKFDSFFKYAKERMDVDLVATGHYARTEKNFVMDFSDMRQVTDFTILDKINDSRYLYKAVDQEKDQTFFLHKISSQSLKRTIFPIGGLRKSIVKSIAEENGLEFVASRKESMGICFIGLRNFQNFILDYIPPKKGNFVCLETGKVLGRHNGYFKYTLGQRARLGGLDITRCISHKDVESGHVYVAPGSRHPALFSKAILIHKPYWISGVPEDVQKKQKLECGFRFMHREPIINCTLFPYKNYYLVVLDRPLRSLTPGQSAVFYSESCCIGGADICYVGPSAYEVREKGMDLLSFRTDVGLWNKVFEQFGPCILPTGEEELQNLSLPKSKISSHSV